MYGFSLIDKFRSLDIYRKLPNDFVQPTYSGALSNSNFLSKYFLIYSIYNKCNNNVLFINK